MDEADGHGIEEVVLLPAVPPGDHQVGVLEQPEMFGHGDSGHREARRQSTERLSVVAQQLVEEIPPGPVRQCLEHRFHPLMIGNHMVSCQRLVGFLRRWTAGVPEWTDRGAQSYRQRMIRHVVLVKVEGDAAIAALESALAHLSQVVDRLPGALSFACGPSNSPEQLERGYTYGLVIDFSDAQALHDYAVDAEHVAAGALITSLAAGGQDGLLVVDLELVDRWP